MKSDLTILKQILEGFIDNIKKRHNAFNVTKELVQEPKKINNIDYWSREECYAWINAEPYSCFLQKEAKKLDIPPIFSEKALKYYKLWLEKYLDIQDYQKCIIPFPNEEQTLLQYLHHIYELPSIKAKLTERWKISLRSFCDFLRKEYLDEEKGFLDVIFPKKMDFFDKQIIRKIPIEVYPIDIIDTQVILKQLVHDVINGRPNVQKTLAEVLALCWICLVCANYRTITELKLLTDQNIIFSNLIKQNTPKEKILFGKADYYSDLESYYILIPTLFFEEKLKISKTLYDYLYGLCEINKGKVFTSPLRSLRRSLASIMESVNLSSNPADITFITFLSKPHEHIGHRYKPKK